MAQMGIDELAGERGRAPVAVLSPGVAVAALAAVSTYALFALVAADDSLQQRTWRFGLGDGLPWRAGVGSLTVALAVYLLADGGTSWCRPTPGPSRDVAWFCGLWLAGLAAGTFGLREGVTEWDGWAEAAGAVLLGPLTEELVFRGALFALATRVAGDRWPGRRAAWLFPILFTAVAFWVGHLQYAWFDAPGWIDRRGYTILGGGAYGWLRHRTGSLWPPVALHSVGNAIALLAGTV